MHIYFRTYQVVYTQLLADRFKNKAWRGGYNNIIFLLLFYIEIFDFFIIYAPEFFVVGGVQAFIIPGFPPVLSRLHWLLPGPRLFFSAKVSKI
jgi:hypothetical protein